MKLKNETVAKSLEVLFGLGAGYITSRLTQDGNFSILMSIVISILVTIGLEVFRIQDKQENLKNTYVELIRLIEERRIEYGDIKLILDFGYPKIDKEKMHKVWAYLLWSLNGDYHATNYISAEKIYNEPWADVAYEIQKIKILRENRSITKVFIVDDVNDLKNFENEKNRQTEACIGMKFILKDEIDRKFLLKKHTESCSIDFGIFNNKIVLIWDINNKRNFIGGRLIFDKNEIDKYVDFYNDLTIASKSYDELLKIGN